MVLSGEKKEEYRAISDYWERRLIDKESNFFKDFDSITFTNGYAKNARRFEIKLISISIDGGLPQWGAERNVVYYVLQLGAIINQYNI